jgi:hypothetical protein
MADIFISYSSEDRPRVETLAKSLQDQGWRVFWDRTIPAGKTWREYIGKALENARSVVVVWSKASVKSKWVQEEADWGFDKEILIPILFDAVVPPLGFRAVQAADLTNWDPSQSSPNFEKLVADISAILRSSPPEDNIAEPIHSKVEEKKQGQEDSGEAEAERRIDAVAPSNAVIGRSMDVFVQVRFSDSPYLSISDWPFRNKPASLEQTQKATTVKFPKNEKGEKIPASLKIKIVAHEFEIEDEAVKILKVPPAEFSDLISFQLVPRSLGAHRIMIKVYDFDGASVGELPVETDVFEQENAAAKEATIVVLNLNVSVDLETVRYLAQAEDRRQQVEPMPDTIRQPMPKPESKAPPEKRSSGSRMIGNALKLALAASVFFLLVPGIWWYFQSQGLPVSTSRGSRIFVETIPEDAVVEIPDSGKEFRQGMELEPGKYQVRVSSKGYRHQTKPVEIGSGQEVRIKVKLKKKKMDTGP